jgi:[ribosomal protein S5]-alanine N-acetyltransferase
MAKRAFDLLVLEGLRRTKVIDEEWQSHRRHLPPPPAFLSLLHQPRAVAVPWLWERPMDLMSRDALYRELPSLTTERLLLRKLTPADVADVYEYCSDPEVARFMRWDVHESPERTSAVVEDILARYERGTGGPWGIEHRGDRKLIGTLMLGWPNNGDGWADLGYAIHRAYWNRGLMTEALREVIRFAFTRTELNRVQAICEPENVGSCRALEKVGLTLEGTLREWQFYKGRHRDLRMYAALRREWTG